MTFMVELEGGTRKEYSTVWEDYEDEYVADIESDVIPGSITCYGKITPCRDKDRRGCDHLNCALSVAEHEAEYHDFIFCKAHDKVMELGEFQKHRTINGIKANVVPHPHYHTGDSIVETIMGLAAIWIIMGVIVIVLGLLFGH